jgi:hypothetical protein
MTSYDSKIFNAALELATEWGENFGKPIADRLRERFSDLSDDEILVITDLVRKAEYRIYEFASMEESGRISESDITRIAAEEFPWMDSSHIGRLKNIGMYYARR